MINHKFDGKKRSTFSSTNCYLQYVEIFPHFCDFSSFLSSYIDINTDCNLQIHSHVAKGIIHFVFMIQSSQIFFMFLLFFGYSWKSWTMIDFCKLYWSMIIDEYHGRSKIDFLRLIIKKINDQFWNQVVSDRCHVSLAPLVSFA